MVLQEKTTKEPKFNAFLSTYIADVLVFVAGILSVIVTLVIIYMLCRQSKSLVANMALHHVKTIEAAALKENENCEFELMRFLIILNLAMTILLVLIKIKKSRVFQGCLFTNIVKVHPFIADTQSYVPLELNRIAGNVHQFKYTGALLIEIFTLKKNWIWHVLGIKWNNVHVTLNDKEINLPGTLTILLDYKLKVRRLFTERSSLHVYIMLKQRQSWYNLEKDWD